jgi:hypothetical protein
MKEKNLFRGRFFVSFWRVEVKQTFWTFLDIFFAMLKQIFVSNRKQGHSMKLSWIDK